MKIEPCPKCKTPMIISSWDGGVWMCFHCDHIGKKATDEEIERQEDEVETMKREYSLSSKPKRKK